MQPQAQELSYVSDTFKEDFVEWDHHGKPFGEFVYHLVF